MSETEEQDKKPALEAPHAFDGVTGEPLFRPSHEQGTSGTGPTPDILNAPTEPHESLGVEPAVAKTLQPDPVLEEPIQLPPPDNSDAWRNFRDRPAFEPVVHEPVREEQPFEPPFVPVAYVPETTEETVRQSGLAWSMGAVFFGSVAFMLFLGWLADLLLGSSPWGIVVGVVLGSIIGFIQFFRISSQIFAPKKTEKRSFLSDDDG